MPVWEEKEDTSGENEIEKIKTKALSLKGSLLHWCVGLFKKGHCKDKGDIAG